MDFVSGLPITAQKNDAVWMIVDRLTKSAHFIPVRKSMSFDILAELYIRELIRLHGVPISIVSDRDLKFTSRLWKSLQKALGTRVNLSTTFHLQTDDFNSDGSTEKQVKIIQDRLKQAFDRQKAYVDTKRRDILYEVKNKVFLKVSLWKKVLQFGKKGKLNPRYIGPFEVIEKVGYVAYRLTLPPEFDKIHSVFHVSMLLRYRSYPLHVLEPEEVELNSDLSYEEEHVMIPDREIKRL
ncbi:hypothetical protein V6N11_051693 [Hibiscus sabdariffa]|uniref:Integrase catalytic domain-containing protein n=1 Tax=Hibiscus sabdariffa TaxID=183260 RepID=A0ABR2U803_9ROSI